MADLLSIAGILAIAYIGKKINDNKHEPELIRERYEPAPPVAKEFPKQRILDTFTGKENILSKEVLAGSTFADIAPDRYPGGLPFYLAETSNPYRSGQMNNLSPVDKIMVGPGLGVGPDVPAYGGYQQLYRVKPPNVGAYRLTELVGRSGPASDQSGYRSGTIGEFQQKSAPKVAFLPSRRPPVKGQAATTYAPTGHESYEKTKRPTARSETSHRSDGLNFGPGLRTVKALQAAQPPTRNKGDYNTYDGRTTGPQPGIDSFRGAYVNTPEVQYLENKGDLGAYGLRDTDTRDKASRAGNKGQMNLKMNNPGNLTSVRTGYIDEDGVTVPHANGGRFQNYVLPTYRDQGNTMKGMENPLASQAGLSTAQRVLQNNPLVN